MTFYFIGPRIVLTYFGGLCHLLLFFMASFQGEVPYFIFNFLYMRGHYLGLRDRGDGVGGGGGGGGSEDGNNATISQGTV